MTTNDINEKIHQGRNVKRFRETIKNFDKEAAIVYFKK